MATPCLVSTPQVSDTVSDTFATNAREGVHS